jgi:hypothetical protein
MPINSFLYPAPSTPTFAYDVANSCRFDDGSSDYLNITPSSAGNRKTWTWSGWVKRGTFGANSIFEAGTASNNSLGFQFESGTDNLQFFVYNGSSLTVNVKTTQVFRDVSAWYHIVVAFDTTQGTASNRVKLYVNGSQVTDLAATTYPSQNTDYNINNTNTHQLGRAVFGGSNYFDGYMAEVVLIDGTALDPTSFGEFDEDSPNIWKPKDVSGLTFGTNGFHLDFENASNLGADVSGNSNNFTVNNLTSVDQSTDTCTNNFATLNPLATNTNTSSSDFKQGNLVLGPNSSGTWIGCTNTIGVTTGKWYAEYKILESGTSQNGIMVGVTNSDLSDFQNRASDLSQTGAFGLNYYAAGTINNNGSGIATYTAMSDDDIVQIALDVDNGKVYWGRNGTYENSGDPTSGSTGTGAQNLSLITTGGTYNLHLCCRNNGHAQANYGSPPYSISSGNSDANGHGNFEYAVPSGYFALCSKNLAEFG